MAASCAPVNVSPISRPFAVPEVPLPLSFT
jgi:hypothetical protein